MTESVKQERITAEHVPERRRLGLSELVLISLALGIAVGVFFGEMADWMEIVGEIFIKLLQVTVIPFISLSLITGLGGLKYETVKRLALKGGAVLLTLWAITLLVIMLSPLSFPSWPSSSFFSMSLTEETSPPDFLRIFIPSNPFNAYANAIVPAIVVFSVLIGVALIGVKKKEVVLAPLLVAQEVLMRITGMIAKLAPVGVFALIASAVGTIDYADLARLQVFIVLYALIALALGLWVLPGLITVLTPLRYGNIVRALRTPLITAFATGSSLIVVPLLIEQCRQLIADAKIYGKESQEKAESSVEVLIPTVYPFPSPAVLLALSFLLFSGWYIGSDVPVAAYPNLILAGVPSLFGGTLIAIPFLLDLLKLPSDLLGVFVSVDVINSRFGTFLAAMHYATVGLIGSIALVGGVRLRLIPLMRYALISTALVAGILFGVRAFYSYVVVAPYTKAEALQGLRLQMEPQPATVYREIPPHLAQTVGKPATLREIDERGVLRVCHQPNEYPSSFYNNVDPPELVGFDVEMVHRLALELRLPIEFLPARREREAAELLNNGACDIYMRTLPITARRITRFAMTSPVYESSVGLIVKDHRRHEFGTWALIEKNEASLRFGVPDSAIIRERVRSSFPGATLVTIGDREEQLRILESRNVEVDAIFDMSEEAAAWTVLYPTFNLVVPKPVMRFGVGYAVAHGNAELLASVNGWLAGERTLGTADTLYSYWMLGGAAKIRSVPRWSVIRDVLGWVE